MMTLDFGEGPSEGGEAARTLRVLVLDDDEIDRMRLLRMCQKTGMSLEPTEAATLAELRSALDRAEYDLIFLDYSLGMDTGLDGLKLVQGHADQADAIPIMVTSVARHDIAVAAMRNGCADYLLKEELTVAALRKSIATAVERRMFLSALGNARAFQRATQQTIGRFSRSCGPEFRGALSATLRQIRQLRASGAVDSRISSELTALERSTKDIVVLLDDLISIVDLAEGRGKQAPRPLPRLT